MDYEQALKKLTTPKQWNDYYYNKYGRFRVQLFIGRPTPWVNYTPTDFPKDTYDFPNHRERFVDELVVDVDGKKPDSTTHAYPCFRRFADANISCSLWESGGDGYHIHAFFPELKTLTPDNRKIMLEVMKKTILKGLIRPPGLDSHICGSNPSLYQLETAKHRKGGYKNLLATNKTGKPNRIPAECWKQYHITRKKEEKERENFKNIKETIGDKPYFIEYFEQERFYNGGDGKKRAAFIMASYYGLQDPKPIMIKQKLRAWNSYTLRNALTEQEINGITNSVIKYHNGSGIRMPYNYAKELLKELGRMDVWNKTITVRGNDNNEPRKQG